MVSALNAAAYIIYYENINGRTVTNLRLQKLLYFAQAQRISDTGSPLFNDDMEAWDFGPVIPVVYHKYKIFGASTIPSCKGTDCALGLLNKNSINRVLDYAARFSTTQLVEMTHSQRPWRNAYRRMNNLISVGSMKEYFCGG